MFLDPASVNGGDLYRLLIRTVVPRPIAWVSTRSTEGVHNLAPFSFFTAVSVNPPTLCFAPGRRPGGGERKDTLTNVEETGEFVVNVVTEELGARMHLTGTDFPPDVDEFDVAGLTLGEPRVVSAPLVKESPVNFECKRYEIVHIGPDGTGGSSLVIGEIVAIHVDDAVMTDGRVDPDLLAAIGRMGGFEYTRTRDRFTLAGK